MFYILFFLTVSFLAHADEPVFQILRTIGDERENYFLTDISGIALSDNKDIYIMDKKKFSLLRFNLNGVFVSRTGGRGQGPDDFLTPAGPQWLNHRLYIYDRFNHRFAVTGRRMDGFEYIPVHDLTDSDGRAYAMRSRPIVLDPKRFLGVNQRYSPDKGRLFFFDHKKKVNTWFFCDLPTDLDDEKWRLNADREKAFLFNFCTYPIVGVNHEKKHMLITFERPDADMRFYLYGLDGELIRRFTYSLDERIRFPMPKLDNLRYRPRHFAWVTDIIVCKNYYLVYMLEVFDSGRSDKREKNSYLIISEDGEVVRRVDTRVRYLDATPDGYLAGVTWDNENDLLKIVISKLNASYLSRQR